jgi:site-specific recombinase XerD
MKLSAAIDGYLIDARARRLSENTLADYTRTFRRFTEFMVDADIENIGADDVRRFLTQFDAMKAKTVLNMFTALSALWTWAMKEKITTTHIIREVTPPREDVKVILPFTEHDIRAIVKASTRSTFQRGGRVITTRLHHAARNKAIAVFLLDTGVRASELCQLKINDVDLKIARVHVLGKDRKERYIDFSPQTAKIVWRYLSTQRKDAAPDEPLFCTDEGAAFDRFSLARLVSSIGKRAGVEKCRPHRFRHTFAVLSLINGADPFTLQSNLGHNSLEIVRRYIHIADVDRAKIQRRASPVANLLSR